MPHSHVRRPFPPHQYKTFSPPARFYLQSLIEKSNLNPIYLFFGKCENKHFNYVLNFADVALANTPCMRTDYLFFVNACCCLLIFPAAPDITVTPPSFINARTHQNLD